MAAIGALFPTVVDLAKRSDPTGEIATVVEALSKKNSILQDLAFKEGNLETGHRFTSRTALPTPTWRRLNQGIAASKSTTDQFDEVCGSLEGLSKVDDALVELSGKGPAFRADEDNGFMTALNIEFARALMYESVTSNPDRMQGFTSRLNATSGNPAAAQIIKADSSASGADQTSIWLVGWSPETVFCIYPKGTKAGVTNRDLGLRLALDANGNEFPAWVTHWRWRVGLCVRDSRYLVRIANIDTSNLKADLSAGADITLALYDAVAAMYELESVQPVIYMNRQTFSMWNKQLAKKGTVNLLEYLDRGGSRVAHFLGIPVRIVDAITNTESVVS